MRWIGDTLRDHVDSLGVGGLVLYGLLAWVVLVFVWRSSKRETFWYEYAILGALVAVLTTAWGATGEWRASRSAADPRPALEVAPGTDAERASGLLATARVIRAEDVEALGKELFAAVAAVDEKKIYELINEQMLMSRCIVHSGTGADARTRNFAAGFVSRSAKEALAAEFLSGLAGPESRILRIKNSGRTWDLLLRAIDQAGNLNYIEVKVAAAKGKPVPAIIDYLSYREGEYFSRTVSRRYARVLQNMPAHKDNPIPVLGEAIALLAVTEAADEGDLDRAHRLLEELPEAVQSSSHAILLRFWMTDDPDRGKALLSQLAELHPDLPTLAFHQFTFLAHHDVEGAMAALDRLKASVGEEPYLEGYRAHFLLQLERTAEARAAAESALAAEPTLRYPHWILAKVEAVEGNYHETAEHLKTLELDRASLGGSPAFEAFLRSPAAAELPDSPSAD